MTKGYINSIETMGLVDGPGIRVVVFLQGCKLRCSFCHNPETWQLKKGTETTPDEIVTMLRKYRNYFENSGGVTFSGGEPLLQPEFLIETLSLCKKAGIHTCIDTAGIGVGKYDEILKYVDLVILDIKALNEDDFKKITLGDFSEYLKFLDACMRNNKKLWLRQVVVPGINDTFEYMEKLADFVKEISNVEKVQLLPYHTLGVDKYEKLKTPYRLKDVPDFDKDYCNKLEEYLLSKLDIKNS